MTEQNRNLGSDDITARRIMQPRGDGVEIPNDLLLESAGIKRYKKIIEQRLVRIPEIRLLREACSLEGAKLKIIKSYGEGNTYTHARVEIYTNSVADINTDALWNTFFALREYNNPQIA